MADEIELSRDFMLLGRSITEQKTTTSLSLSVGELIVVWPLKDS
jgi:hypothetical protein